MSKADILAVKIAQEIERALKERLGGVGNAAIRKAIEENIRDGIYDKLDKKLSKELTAIIDESIDDVVTSLQGATKKKAPRSPSNDFGAKSGSKTSYTPPSRDYGGKGSSRFGGK